MGCGCGRGGRRPVSRPTIGPLSRTSTSTNNSSQRLRATSKPTVDVAQTATGMTKQQRDAERKKRIQAIIAKKSGQ